MELKVAERLMLMSLLAPIEGDITALRLVRSLQGQLGFNEEETAALAFKQVVKYICMACGQQYPEPEEGALESCPACKGALRAQPAGQIRWQGGADVPVEIEIGPAAKAIIANQLKKASATKSLSLQQLDLYEKFVEEEETPPSE